MRRDLVAIRAQILAAREAVELERAQSIEAARSDVRLMLGEHGRFMASAAMRADPNRSAYRDFARMATRIREGGFHAGRKSGRVTVE